MTRLGQPPDAADIAEHEENRRLAEGLSSGQLTPLSKLAAPPGAETIRAASTDTVDKVATDIAEGEQLAAGIATIVPAAFRYEHYVKLALSVAGTVFGGVVAIVDPTLLPLASVISGGSLTYAGIETHAHSKGP